jgi:hypothetical protein
MISICVKQKVEARPSQVKEILLQHEYLDQFFNAKFLLLKIQNEGEITGGKGSIRQVSMLGDKFQEQIISADNQHISYQIIGNKPVAKHRGDIYFHTDNNNPLQTTEISYNIICKSPWWIPSFILGFFITKDIIQALKKLALHFKGEAHDN